MSPQRVQRRRTAGWTTPVDEHGRPAVYVGRGSRFGNPSRIIPGEGGWSVVHDNNGCGIFFDSKKMAHEFAVDAYRHHLKQHPELVERARAELAGRWLSCWCPKEQACHADVLLAVAAGEEP